MDEDEQFAKWLADGAANGWVSLPVCVTHDAFPARGWEDFALIQGADPCIFMLRLWRDGMEDVDDAQMMLFWSEDDETE